MVVNLYLGLGVFSFRYKTIEEEKSALFFYF
jgi:hypothetical protein